MTKRLIVNADDFGLSPGVNEGIIDAHRMGIVRSATLLANASSIQDAIERAKRYPNLGLGCHLSLIGGPALAPVSRIPHLADGQGRLPRGWPQLMARLAGGAGIAELAAEFRAQLYRLTSCGVRLTHVDSHKHVHILPQVLEAAFQAASDFGIRAIRNPYESVRRRYLTSGGSIWARPETASQFSLATAIRIFAPSFQLLARARGFRYPDQFFGVTFTGSLNPHLIRSLLRALPDGVSELMCHPGRLDAGLRAEPTRLREQRERELRALTDPGVLQTIRESGIELVNYRRLL
ncbi:MAG: ChbG/HpnK family deacetylase [Acidobacteria bacterium]|nr:ChbG/HpnK family deacetylase [Acidobacteriota bacterium]